jgi:hypothetical protein
VEYAFIDPDNFDLDLNPYSFDQSEQSQGASADTPIFSEEDWFMRLRQAAKKDAEVRWEIGDLLNEGEPHFPEIGSAEFPGCPAMSIYTLAETETGLTSGTLRDYASTARRVPQSVRTDGCSWSHHRALVNALPGESEETYRHWLQRAVHENMSIVELKDAIRPKFKDAVKHKTMLVKVPLKVWETLKDFADNERIAVQVIASRWLTEKVEEQQPLREVVKQETRARRRDKRRQVGLRVARQYDPLRLQCY